MLYAAMTFWLLVVVLTAWAVLNIWGGLLRPRIVNTALLPGTVVAQIGHVLGVLLTGGEINRTQLVKDDESGEPATAPDPKPKIPVIGPIIIAMLPLVACGVGVYVIMRLQWAPASIRSVSYPVSDSLPLSLGAFWQMLRDAVTAVETLVGRLANIDWAAWQTWAFFYLIVCMTVRMAPLPGNLRGALGAILVLGLAAALIGNTWPSGRAVIQQSWPILSFSVAALLLLLLVSLLVKGVIELLRLVYERR